MGNSCYRCFGITKKKSNKYIRSDLSQSRDFSIEFENLMTNDYFDDLSISSKKDNSAPFTVSSYMKWLSDQERVFMEDDEYDSGGMAVKKSVQPIISSKSQELSNQNLSSTTTNCANTSVNTTKVPNVGFIEPKKTNWETFEDPQMPSSSASLASKKIPIYRRHEMNDNFTSYFIDELSRDLGVSRDLIEGCCCGLSDVDSASGPPTYQEEEIDGPELARLVRRMRPRDLLLSAGMGPVHSMVGYSGSNVTNGIGIKDEPNYLSGESSYLHSDNSLTNLYTRIHQNLMKGIRDSRSGATSEKDDNQSSIDLDWDHEPGMNPSLALNHKRTDTEEDIVKMLNNEVVTESHINNNNINNEIKSPVYTDNLSKNRQESQCLPTPSHKPSISTHTLSSSTLTLPSNPNSINNNSSNSKTQQLVNNFSIKNSNLPPLSPDQLFCSDELVWDMEEELLTVDDLHNGDVAISNDIQNNINNIDINNINSSITSNDKCHLLSN